MTRLYVHPRVEDKARLGDVVENQVGNDAMAVRSRAWVDALGPVMPPDQAAALKAARPPPTAELYAKAERAR